jgi:hypothetical protein
MAVRSVLRAGRPLTPEDSGYSYLLEAESTSRAIMLLEELDLLKNSVTSSGFETATFHFVA